MAKKAYIGVDSVARKIKKGYIGVPEFVQPVLTADGTLGGSAFAIYASNYHSADYAAYKAFNGKASDGYSSSVNPSSQTIYLTFYNPVAIKISALKFTNVPSPLTSSSPKAFSVQGSNDNSGWTTIGSFTNTNNTNGATWSVSLSGCFYKYHRLVITSANTTQAYVNIGEISITATMSTGSARKIKKAYIGIGGVARPCWSGGELEYYGTITTLSNTVNDHAATTVGNYALFGGGTNRGNALSSVNAYNASLSRSTPTSLSLARRYLSATTVGSYALFAGGANSNGRVYSAVVDAYNASLARSTPASLSVARYNIGATTVGSYALFAGGYGGSQSAVVDAYTTSLFRTTPTSLSVARSDISATTVGSYALFGGGSGNSAVVDAYSASLARSTPTSLTVGRSSLAATTVGDYALFGGGYGPVDTVEAYNTSLTRSTPTSLSVARRMLAATTVGDYALFGGGYVSSQSAVVDAYDKSLTRSTPTSLSVARYDLRATTVGSYALFAGGYGSDRSAVVDAYTA